MVIMVVMAMVIRLSMVDMVIIIVVVMVVMVIRTDRTTRTHGTNKTDRIIRTRDRQDRQVRDERQDRQICHLNLTFQVTFVQGSFRNSCDVFCNFLDFRRVLQSLYHLVSRYSGLSDNRKHHSLRNNVT